jgi:hypothetical protein
MKWFYLSNTGKLLLDDPLKERMDELTPQNFKIKVRRASDVLGSEDGYRSLNISYEAVLRKHQGLLRCILSAK